MIYSGVWKMHTTPAGRQIYRLRASARRTSVSEHSSSEFGWPTPTATDHKGGYQGGRMRDGKLSTDRLDVTAQLTTWNTPRATDWSNGGPNQAGGALPADAAMAGWPTPMAMDHWMASTIRKDGGQIQLPNAAAMAGWATPVGQQANGTPERFLERKRESMERGSQSMGVSLSDLNMQAQAWAGWPTPAASDGVGGKGPRNGVSMTGRMPDGSKVTMDLSAATKSAMDHDGPARLTVTGDLLIGSSAGMESGGQLNPRFSGWLMGYPPEWCEAAISCQLATPSRKKAKPTPDAP
jgi:hypothetical protein